MIYKIADFTFDISFFDKRIKNFLYEYEDSKTAVADFEIKATNEEIDAEIERGKELDGDYGFSRGYYERLAILRKICTVLIEKDAFLVHGALIEYKGKGYLFCAKSGTGKTTHIMLWQKLFGEEVRVINGDKPLLRMIDGELYGYGTPWCGKEGLNINARTKLDRICFIERAECNSISPADEFFSLQRLLSQVMITDSANLDKQLSLVDKLLSCTKSYRLCCNMDLDAARVAYEGME